MKPVSLFVLSLAAAATAATVAAAIPVHASSGDGPTYASDGRLVPPVDYREWIYLSSGLDMSYRERTGMNHSMFDNVFASPAAYRGFVATGTWPDKTVLVMEVRGASSKGSINVTGKFQTPERMGMEVHVKDEARFPGGWAFFAFDDDKPAAKIPESASCYACHREHGAVDTTFVQFYPTLIGIAGQHGTLSDAYRRESEAEKAVPDPDKH